MCDQSDGEDVAWAIWLALPVAATLVAALITWVRGRPDPVPGTDETMQAHTDYLDALVQTARSKDRTPKARRYS